MVIKCAVRRTRFVALRNKVYLFRSVERYEKLMYQKLSDAVRTRIFVSGLLAEPLTKLSGGSSFLFGDDMSFDKN